MSPEKALHPSTGKLMDMPDEILLRIIELHGCGPEPTTPFVNAVDFAKNVGAVVEDTLVVHVDPTESHPLAKPRAQVCQKLRAIYLRNFVVPTFNKIYVPFPDEVKLPWPKGILGEVKSVTVGPFIKLELDETDAARFRTKVDDPMGDPGHCPSAAQSWAAACDVITGLPHTVKIWVHLHHRWWNYQKMGDMGFELEDILRGFTGGKIFPPMLPNVERIGVHPTRDEPGEYFPDFVTDFLSFPDSLNVIRAALLLHRDARA